MPFFNFGKIFLDIATITNGKYNFLTGTYDHSGNLTWERFFNKLPNNLLPLYSDGEIPDVPTPASTMLLYIYNIIFYSIVTWYFDKVIPNEYGNSLPLNFFLNPTYWGYYTANDESNNIWLSKLEKGSPTPVKNDDAEISLQREAALSSSN
jgi:hypothetical protein